MAWHGMAWHRMAWHGMAINAASLEPRRVKLQQQVTERSVALPAGTPRACRRRDAAQVACALARMQAHDMAFDAAALDLRHAELQQ
jgi:hypothetical protein